VTTLQLQQLWKASPFKPFTIHMADGRHVPVRHSEFLMPSPSGRSVIVYQPDDSFNIIDLLLVTDLEVSANGRAKAAKRGERN
jgi:hypothetical protein